MPIPYKVANLLFRTFGYVPKKSKAIVFRAPFFALGKLVPPNIKPDLIKELMTSKKVGTTRIIRKKVDYLF